jgi:acetyl-CoA carboxylase biotin carboxyl carrier protein
MIDIRKLKELVRLMVDNDLTELDLKDQEETVAIRRGPAGGTVVNHQPVIYQGAGSDAAQVAAPAIGAARPRPASEDEGESETDSPSETAGLVPISSPMVGTFYGSPNPDAAAFVQVGAGVSPGTTVCLIEAMKVFNEIKAEVSGTIERVLVKSGDSVEFGQDLFLVRPS